MTEGILGRAYQPSVRTGSVRRGFTRIHARALSRRYARACRRAHAATRLCKLLNAVYAFFVAAGMAVMPARYALSGVFTAAADRADILSDRWSCGRAAMGRALRDLASMRPRALLKTRRARAVTVLLFAAAGVLLFTTLFYSTGLEVILNGTSLGYVTSQNEVEKSIRAVEQRVSDILDRPYAFHPDLKYDLSSVRRSLIFDQAEFEQLLFASVTDIREMYVLYIDGQAVGACTEAGEAEDVLAAHLAQYPVTGSYDSVGFIQDVRVELQYADAALAMPPAELSAMLKNELRPAVYDLWLEDDTPDSFCQRNGIPYETLQTYNLSVDLENVTPGQKLLIHNALPYLSVAQNRRITYEVAVAYETVYEDSDSLYKGESKVVKDGVPGIALVTADQMYVDGQVAGMNVLSESVTTEPVSEVVAQGTKVKYALGTFIRPYGGRISSPYGYRSMGFHSGIDYAGPKGDKIAASDGGKVVFAGRQGTYGNLVVIQHDNKYSTAYAHCSAFKVKVGQMVAQGDTIALIGSTGRSTGPHVHFEIRVNGKAVNPAKYLNKK